MQRQEALRKRREGFQKWQGFASFRSDKFDAVAPGVN